MTRKKHRYKRLLKLSTLGRDLDHIAATDWAGELRGGNVEIAVRRTDLRCDDHSRCMMH